MGRRRGSARLAREKLLAVPPRRRFGRRGRADLASARRDFPLDRRVEQPVYVRRKTHPDRNARRRFRRLAARPKLPRRDGFERSRLGAGPRRFGSVPARVAARLYERATLFRLLALGRRQLRDGRRFRPRDFDDRLRQNARQIRARRRRRHGVARLIRTAYVSSVPDLGQFAVVVDGGAASLDRFGRRRFAKFSAFRRLNGRRSVALKRLNTLELHFGVDAPRGAVGVLEKQR